jgi:hypothetical protein
MGIEHRARPTIGGKAPLDRTLVVIVLDVMRPPQE